MTTTTVHADAEELTGPCYEQETFDSIWQALQWKHIRARVPICMKKTIRSRYMLANMVYLLYAIGILIIDFNSNVNGSSADDTTTDGCDNTTSTYSGLDQPIDTSDLVNRLYIGKKKNTNFNEISK